MKKKEPYLRYTGFTLIELIVVLAVSAILFISSKNFIATYSLENSIKKVAYASIDLFSVASYRGKHYGNPCNQITLDPTLSMSTNKYTASCSSSGNKVSLIVTGINDVSGIRYEISNIGTSMITRTYLSGTIISKFDPAPTSTTINDCIVGDLALNCIKKSSGFILTP